MLRTHAQIDFYKQVYSMNYLGMCTAELNAKHRRAEAEIAHSMTMTLIRIIRDEGSTNLLIPLILGPFKFFREWYCSYLPEMKEHQT